MKHKLTFLAILAVITFASCEKENETTDPVGGDTPAAAPSKKLKKVSVSWPGNDGGSYDYVWEGDKLKSVTLHNVNDIMDEIYTFTYSGDKLSKANYRCDHESRTYECVYTWNGDQISTEKYTEYDYGSTDVLTYHYTYSGNKPTRLAIYWEGDPEPDQLNLAWTGNNITQYYYDDDDDEITFTYDNKKNPLYLPHMGYVPGFLSGIGLHTICWSENNITHFEVSDTKGGDSGDGVGNYTYTYDDDGYPSTMTFTVDNKTYTLVYTYYE